MNIEDIRAERKALEISLFKLFREFRKNTGLSVIACEVRNASSTQIGFSRDHIELTQVDVEIESI